MAVFALLSGFVTINLIGITKRSSFNSILLTMTADIKNQQLKAMALETNGRETPVPFGITFSQNNYTLFQGVIFDPADSSNFTVNLDESVVVNQISLPDNTLIFSLGSGEILSFDPVQNRLTLQNTLNGEEKTLIVNKYGVITELN